MEEVFTCSSKQIRGFPIISANVLKIRLSSLISSWSEHIWFNRVHRGVKIFLLNFNAFMYEFSKMVQLRKQIRKLNGGK